MDLGRRSNNLVLKDMDLGRKSNNLDYYSSPASDLIYLKMDIFTSKWFQLS